MERSFLQDICYSKRFSRPDNHAHSENDAVNIIKLVVNLQCSNHLIGLFQSYSHLI